MNEDKSHLIHPYYPKNPITEEQIFDDVIALTIIDNSTTVDDELTPKSKLWICVRDEKTNDTHPNVVSVPTQRIPRCLANDLLGEHKQLSPISTGDFVTVDKEWVSSNIHEDYLDSDYTTIHVVTELMAMKLDLADTLTKNKLRFRAKPTLYTINRVDHPNLGENTYENLRMINIQVQITTGVDCFVEKTESYSHGRWVTIEQFMSMMDGKDTTHVGLDGFRYCVTGLCVSTTAALFNNKESL